MNEGMLQGKADNYNQLGALNSKVAVEEASVYAKQWVSWFVGTYKLPHSQSISVSDLFANDLML